MTLRIPQFVHARTFQLIFIGLVGLGVGVLLPRSGKKVPVPPPEKPKSGTRTNPSRSSLPTSGVVRRSLPGDQIAAINREIEDLRVLIDELCESGTNQIPIIVLTRRKDQLDERVQMLEECLGWEADFDSPSSEESSIRIQNNNQGRVVGEGSPLQPIQANAGDNRERTDADSTASLPPGDKDTSRITGTTVITDIPLSLGSSLFQGVNSAQNSSNFVQGAVRKVFNFAPKAGSVKAHKENFANVASSIKAERETAYYTSVDAGETFAIETESSYNTDMGMWTGFLKRKTGGDHTIVISTNGGNLWPMYSLWINGSQIISAETETTVVDVSLTAGFNEVCLIVEGTQKKHVTVTIKKKDSLKEPKTITPGDLWHGEESDDEDNEG